MAKPVEGALSGLHYKDVQTGSNTYWWALPIILGVGQYILSERYKLYRQHQYVIPLSSLTLGALVNYALRIPFETTTRVYFPKQESRDDSPEQIQSVRDALELPKKAGDAFNTVIADNGSLADAVQAAAQKKAELQLRKILGEIASGLKLDGARAEPITKLPFNDLDKLSQVIAKSLPVTSNTESPDEKRVVELLKDILQSPAAKEKFDEVLGTDYTNTAKALKAALSIDSKHALALGDATKIKSVRDALKLSKEAGRVFDDTVGKEKDLTKLGDAVRAAVECKEREAATQDEARAKEVVGAVKESLQVSGSAETAFDGAVGESCEVAKLGDAIGAALKIQRGEANEQDKVRDAEIIEALSRELGLEESERTAFVEGAQGDLGRIAALVGDVLAKQEEQHSAQIRSLLEAVAKGLKLDGEQFKIIAEWDRKNLGGLAQVVSNVARIAPTPFEVLQCFPTIPHHALEAAERMCEALRDGGDWLPVAQAIYYAHEISYLDLNGLTMEQAEFLKQCYPNAYSAPAKVENRYQPEQGATLIVANTEKAHAAILGPIDDLYATAYSDRAIDYQLGVFAHWWKHAAEVVSFDVGAAALQFGGAAKWLAKPMTGLQKIAMFADVAPEVLEGKKELKFVTIYMTGCEDCFDWIDKLPEGLSGVTVISPKSMPRDKELALGEKKLELKTSGENEANELVYQFGEKQGAKKDPLTPMKKQDVKRELFQKEEIQGTLDSSNDEVN